MCIIYVLNKCSRYAWPKALSEEAKILTKVLIMSNYRLPSLSQQAAEQL